MDDPLARQILSDMTQRAIINLIVMAVVATPVIIIIGRIIGRCFPQRIREKWTSQTYIKAFACWLVVYAALGCLYVTAFRERVSEELAEAQQAAQAVLPDERPQPAVDE